MKDQAPGDPVVEVALTMDPEAIATGRAGSVSARVTALGVETHFIEGLAETVVHALGRNSEVAPGSGFTCAARWSKCPARAGGASA